MGTPFSFLMTIFLISSRLRTKPSPRMKFAWWFFSMYAPPVFLLFASNASNTSVIVRPIAFNSLGSTATSYCFIFPPMALISTTPGTIAICRCTIQSCIVRKSDNEYLSSNSGSTFKVYWYTSPKPVEIGPILGCPKPSGICSRTSVSFSETSWRGK